MGISMHGAVRSQRCFLQSIRQSNLARASIYPAAVNNHTRHISSIQRTRRGSTSRIKNIERQLPIRSAVVRAFTTSSASLQSASRLVDYLLADVGEGITECEIVKWFVEPGSMVEEFDVLVEVQSDKASVEITSRYAGRVAEHCYKVGDVAKVGSALCKIEVQGSDEDANSEMEEEATSESKDTKTTTTTTSPLKDSTAGDGIRSEVEAGSSSPLESQGKSGSLATPAVRRIVREHGVDIDKVRGTGKSGRVTKEDVQGYMASKPSLLSETTGDKAGAVKEDEGEKSVPLSGTRKAMYKAMSTTWNIPHFGYSDEIDITKLDHIRKEMQKSGDSGYKLTLLPFLLKALSMAMYDHPIFRSILDSQNMILQEKQQHRISIALSSSRGLLTPTLQSDIRKASVLEIADQIHQLQQISSERGLNQRELGSGATVTLSNIGSIGGLYTFPLIPPTGQLIIGAIGRSRLLPRFDQEGNIKKALILPASFSADHRVVEGVELAKFVQDWKQLVENPMSWLARLR